MVAQLLFGLIQVGLDYSQKVETLKGQVDDLGKQLQIITEESNLNIRDFTLERLIRQTSVRDAIVYGIISDRQGQMIASFLNQDNLSITQAINNQNQGLNPLDINTLIQEVQQNTTVRQIKQPIIIGGQLRGEIRLSYSLAQVKQESLRSASRIVISSLTVSGLLILIIVTCFKKEVSQPLEKLTRDTQRLLDKDNFSNLGSGDVFSQLENLIANLVEKYQNIKSLESQIAQEQTIEEVERTKNEFLAMIGHEIRTPLNAVTGMTGLLLDTNLTPKQQEFIKIIRSSGENLLTMINNILDLSKIEAEKLELEEQPFELGQCIEEVLRLFVPQASAKKLELAYLIEPNTPSAIIGDSTRLRQILANLLGNGVKFTETGEVVVYVSATPLVNEDASPETNATYEIRFAVKDTGIGIAPEDCDRLFQSFTQVDTSTTRKYGGTGLGLVISKRLSELMGGKMWVHSNSGKGSTFYFTIKAQGTASLSLATSPNKQQDLIGKRVLIVDDNLTNRKILTLQTQSWGMFTCAVESGAKALEWLEQGIKIDVAILDLNMPDMDGLTLAKVIRQHPNCKTLPIIMLSSITKEEIAPEIDSSDLFAILIKPIQQSQLYQSLRQIFSSQSVTVVQEFPESSEIQVMPSNHPLRVLVAEDVTVNQKVIGLLLDKLGYWADMVSNGHEVLEALDNQQYDVIFMDVRMPEMDGFETTRQILRDFRARQRPRIIAMTAEAMRGDREHCLAMGMDDYLPKPIRLDQLAQALAKCQPIIKKTVLDPGVLNSLRQMAGKQSSEIIADLITGYLEDSPICLLAIEKAVVQQDAERIRQEAHSLRSASANLGATHLSRLCQDLEMMGRKGQVSGARPTLEAIKMEYDQVCLALQQEIEDTCNRKPLIVTSPCESVSPPIKNTSCSHC